MIKKALIMASEAHEKQIRKGTNIPYILHPMEAGVITYYILEQLNRFDENVIASALLHDTVEDTSIDEEFLLTHFNKRVSDLVLAQSEDKTKSWKERKQSAINMLNKTKDIDVKILYLADKLSNMRAINKDYDKLGDKIWDRFNEKRKNEQGWYYLSICQALNELEYTNEYQQFKFLINKIFN